MSTFNFKNSFKLLSLSIVAVMFFNGCSLGDNSPLGCSVRWAIDLQDELALLSSTAVAYSQNETEANCEAYRNALQAYLNKLKPYGNCQALTGKDRADFQESLDDAQESIDELNCKE